MRIVCAWCQKTLGMKEPVCEHTVTHGICEACAKTFLNKDTKHATSSTEKR